jgi:hypothetical protein
MEQHRLPVAERSISCLSHSGDSIMKLQVETRTTALGDPEPTAFLLGPARIDVIDIVDRWPAPGYTYYKIAGSDEATYILRYDEPSEEWELTMFQS